MRTYSGRGTAGGSEMEVFLFLFYYLSLSLFHSLTFRTPEQMWPNDHEDYEIWGQSYSCSISIQWFFGSKYLELKLLWLHFVFLFCSIIACHGSSTGTQFAHFTTLINFISMLEEQEVLEHWRKFHSYRGFGDIVKISIFCQSYFPEGRYLRIDNRDQNIISQIVITSSLRLSLNFCLFN